MVVVENDALAFKPTQQELDKFENILTRQNRTQEKSNRNKSIRNASLDETYLINAQSDRKLSKKSLIRIYNNVNCGIQSNSVAANLNDRHYQSSFYENKLNEFIDIKNKLINEKIISSSPVIHNLISSSTSSSESDSNILGSPYPSPSTNLSKPQQDIKFEDECESKESEEILNSLGLIKKRSKLLSSLSSDLDDDEDLDDPCINGTNEEDDCETKSNYSSRRETVIYKSNIDGEFNKFESSLFEFRNKTANETNEIKEGCETITSPSDEHLSLKDLNVTCKIQNSKDNDKKNDTSNSSNKKTNSRSMACEVTSLSSMTSNYSQFEFFNIPSSSYDKNRSPSPPIKNNKEETKPSNPLTSFFFSKNLFKSNKKPPVIPESPKNLCDTGINASNFSSNRFDLITSKLLNLKPGNKASEQVTLAPMPYSLHSSSSSLSNICVNSDTQSIRSNHSSQNLSSFFSGHNNSMSSSASVDLKMPNSVLIFENRPSNLPAKSQQEAIKHKQEYEKMVEAAKKKEQREKEIKFKKYEQQIRKEDFMANSLRIWNTEILRNWKEQKNMKRTQELWWHGLPPSIRGNVWKLAIGNDLNLTKDTYFFYKKKAADKLETLSRNSDKSHESSVELIRLDVSRTFPQLCFFQRDGPYHETLHSVLGAYACFNSKIGYVQGMSFLTAILLLNMEAPDAFICLANLLNTKYLLACFCMDQKKMNRYFRVHEILLQHNIPKLFKHFEEQKVKPDLYLIEWMFTLFSKSLPLDVMSRVWDVFFRDQEEFLFRTSLGILNLYKDTLLEMDFIHIVQFLTKLPENINSTQLFKSIERMKTNIDDSYFTFEQLIDQIVTEPSIRNVTKLC